MKAEALLSDKFVEMSDAVKELFARKKQLTDEFKATAEKFKANVVALDREAEEVHQTFVTWQQEQADAKAKKQEHK